MLSDAAYLELVVDAKRRGNATVATMLEAGCMFYDPILKRWFDRDGLKAKGAPAP